MTGVVRTALRLCALALLTLGVSAGEAAAQRPSTAMSPVEALGRRYQAAHERALTEDLLRRFGATRPIAPPVRLPLQDSVLEARLRVLDYREIPVVVEPLPPPFAVTSVTKVPRFGLPSFQARFGEVPWSFAGNTFERAADTVRTYRLRGALEGRYGSPTRTIGDLGADVQPGVNTAFQFEYWFVVNDSLPLLVSDVGNPRDRGLVVATHARLREWLPLLRAWMLDDLASAPAVSYADYTYNPATRSWAVVGLDGGRFVERPIPRPDIRTVSRPLPSALRR